MESNIEVGTRIYYTGDMANDPAWGTVVMQRGGYCDIQQDNGHLMASILLCAIGHRYNGTCNPRFVTETAYHAWRAERLAAYRR